MKDSKFNLPTPQMLIGRAKETTIPVSLRVKQSTVDIFDKMAAAAGGNQQGKYIKAQQHAFCHN